MGCYAGALACFPLGEFAASRAHAEKGLGLYDSAHRAAYAELLSYDAWLHLRAYSSWPLACLGYLDQAWLRADAALAEARRLSHPHTLVLALMAIFRTGWLVRLEPKSLLHYADEQMAVSVEHGLGLSRVVAAVARGWCLAAFGHSEEGIALLGKGLAGVHDSGWLVFRPQYLTNAADACRMAGKCEAALEHLAEARRLADETGERWCQAKTVRLQGDVLAAMGDSAAAEASYDEAIAIAQRQSAKLWELCAAMSLARLWRDQGKGTKALGLLAPVCNWFTEGFGTPVLQEARALLDELYDASAVPDRRAD
jgi:tetratricopeptide (TPR) repeat protein